MSLATIEALRSSVESAASWLKQAAEQHLPALEADAEHADGELKRLQGSPVVQALEAAGLGPSEEAIVAELISKLPALRGAQSVPAAVSEPVQATIPADVPPPADVTLDPAAQPV